MVEGIGYQKRMLLITAAYKMQLKSTRQQQPDPEEAQPIHNQLTKYQLKLYILLHQIWALEPDNSESIYMICLLHPGPNGKINKQLILQIITCQPHKVRPILTCHDAILWFPALLCLMVSAKAKINWRIKILKNKFRFP